jgi:PAS domain S-box-containing protein
MDDPSVYRHLFQSADVGLARLALDGTILDINEQACQLLYHHQSELIGHSLNELVHPDDLETTQTLLGEMIRSDKSRRIETRHLRKDGALPRMALTLSLVCDTEGQPEFLTAVIEDVSEQTRSDEELRLFKSIFDQIDLGITIADATKYDTPLVYCNKMFETMTQYSHDEALGKNCRYLQGDDREQEGIRTIKAAIETHQPAEALLRNYRKDGTMYWNRLHVAPITDASGELTHYAGIQHDVTDEIMTQQKLRESEIRWQFAVDGSGDGLWDWNMVTNEVYFSPQWKKMLGFEVDEIEASLEEWSNRVHPDQIDGVYADINAYLEGKSDSYANEHQVLCKDGSYKWILDRGMVVQRDETGKPLRMVGTHSDIDERKVLQQNLIKSKKSLDEAQRLAKIGSWYLDFSDNRLEWSDEIYEIFELDPSSFKATYENFISAVHPEERQHVGDVFNASVKNHTLYHVEHRLQMPDGRIKHVVERGETTYDDEDRPMMTTGTVQDISEEVSTRERLQRLNKQLSNLATNVPGLVYSFQMFPDGHSCLPFASNHLYSIYGVTPSEALDDASGIFTAIHPDDLPRIIEKIRISAEDLTPWEDEHRVNHPEKGLLWVHGASQPERQDDGSVIWYGYIYDITTRKENELTMKEQALQMEIASRSGGIGIWTWRLSNNTLQWNDQMYAIYGLTRHQDDNPYSMWRDAVHAEDIDASELKVTEALESKSDFTDTFRIRRPDGEIRYIRASGNFEFDEHGKALAMIGTNIDVTDEREQQEQLQMAKEETEQANTSLKISQNLAKIASWGIDLGIDEIRMSDEFRKMYGVTKATYRFADLLDTIHEGDRGSTQKILTEVFTTPYAGSTQYRILVDGRVKHLNVVWELSRDDTGSVLGFEGYSQDITDQKLIEQQLIDAKLEADQANRFKSEFLANMSHEIRTPMTGILGFVDHLVKGETDPARLKEFDTIRSSGKTLLSIINDILDFSKIESGKLDIESHPFSIYQVLTETSGIFSELLDSKQITLEKIVDESLPACILGDQVRLKQVVFNLLSNAVKFTPDHGTISMETRYDGQRIYVSVEDSGVGIAPEKLGKIFEAFSQEDSSTTRRFGGTGLGLSISSRLIEKMGGQIKVESTLGEGSRFCFDIPVTCCDGHFDTPSVPAAEASGNALDGKVLMVEDNKTNQMLLGIILEEAGVAYDVAGDGVEAVKMFKENAYDVILMDENMPNMNGIEATAQIRQLEQENARKPTPIIAVTANALATDRQRFLDAGMDEYLSKPYSEEDIVKMLKHFLG